MSASDELVSAACAVWAYGFRNLGPLDTRTKLAFDTVIQAVAADFTPEQRAQVAKVVARVQAAS